MPKQVYSIELEERQYKFLQQMVDKYALPDVNKAMRILIDFAVEEVRQQDTVFNEIRCLDC